MVRRYWQILGQPERSVIISREYAYHGSTLVGASLGGMAPMHGQTGLPLPGFEHIRPPYYLRDGGNMTPEESGVAAAQALEERLREIGPEQVAAFIAAQSEASRVGEKCGRTESIRVGDAP